MELHQVGCFNINVWFWKYLGIWPSRDSGPYYKLYAISFIMTFVIIYDLFYTINFYFLPRELDVFVEEMVFYFTELAVLSKVLTFVFMHSEISELFKILESNMFQPDDTEGLEIIKKSMKFNIAYWKIVSFVSILSNMTHVLSPLIMHLALGIELVMPVCSYSFLPEALKQVLLYPIYFYQSIGINFHVLYNMNIDTFFLGLMIFCIAQLDILDGKLRKATETNMASAGSNADRNTIQQELDQNAFNKINQCIIHYKEVATFCSLIQDVFSASLFAQFSMASCIICVCLFRFTMPASVAYYVFLATYMFIMVIQIMVPCWFGTRIMDKSSRLAHAIYCCDWTPRSRRLKNNLRLFVERANQPLSITGGKMFCLSLETFTSIMNSAYSFFTLLQHMQSRN